MTGAIQSQVNTSLAPAVAGDFASANPRKTVLAGPGGFVAGALGLYVGRACWAVNPPDADGAPSILNYFGSGNITGLIGRSQQGLNTTYLSDGSMFIQPGFTPGDVYDDVDLWVKNDGTTQAVPGQKAYANFADGKFTFAATGAPTTGGSGSSSSIAAETASVTGSITGAIMTVTVIGSGTLYPGSTLSGTGVTTGNTILSQLTGTTGGIGTYEVSIAEQSVSSTTISTTYGLLTVGGTVVSGFAVNQTIAGTNVVAGTAITALGTGTGGAGTYVVNNNTVVSTTAINSQTNVETKYFARSSGLAGEVVKISPTTLQ